MPRILKRPMFSRGGSTNENNGIMDGLVDRTNLAKGSPKFDTGKMKEDASSILSKIVKLLPGGKIGEAAAQAASMAKGNESEIIKAIEKILIVTPAGQVGAALKFLADRYRIDPAIVERIAKSKMADANIQTDPSGSADEGFPSRPEFESSAEDTSVMPRTNRFDKFKGSISDKELNEFYDRDELDKLYENIKPVPMPGFEKPPLSPDATTLNPHQDINPMQTMEFRDSNGNGIEDRSEGIYLDRDIIPYDPDREFKSLKNSDMFKKYRDNIEFNQGGSVNYNQGIMRATAAGGGRIGYAEGPTQSEIYAKEYYDQLSKIQPPKSRLNLGKVGLNLAAGKYSGGDLISTLAGAGSDIYDDYTAKDDVRRNLDYKTKMASAKMGISKADAEAIAKAKALATTKKGFRTLTVDEAKSILKTTYNPQKTYQINLDTRQIKPISGTGTNVTINNPYETAEQKKIGEGFGKKFNEINDASTSAFTANQSLELLQDINQMEDVKTGAFGEFRLSAAKLAKEFGFDSDLTNITGSELIAGVSGKIVLDGLSNFKGSISDGERAFVKDITPGLSTSKEGNQKLLEIALRQNELAIALSSEANKWFNANGGLSKIDKESGLTWDGFLIKWQKANPVINEELKESLTQLSKRPDTDFGQNIKTITIDGKEMRGVKIDGRWYELT